MHNKGFPATSLDCARALSYHRWVSEADLQRLLRQPELRMEKKSVHVVPSSKSGWIVKNGGASKASKNFNDKSTAVEWARDRSRSKGSELVIHRRDGMIQEKNSYGNDPRPPRDKR